MNCEQDTLMKDLKGLGLPHSVSEWLSLQMMTRWRCGTNLEFPTANLIGINLHTFIIDSCVKFFRFRPTDEDVTQALGSSAIATIADLATAISFLLRIAPSIDDDVQSLTPANCSASTQQLWQDLSGLLPEDYNDQFALKSYLDRTIFIEATERDSKIDTIDSLTMKESLCWWPRFLAHDLDTALKHAGYKYKIGPSPKSSTEINCKVGDILKLLKQSDKDSMLQYVLVTKTADRAIQLAEFKPNFGGPFQATSKGLDLFFFRDPGVGVDGIWQSPN